MGLYIIDNNYNIKEIYIVKTNTPKHLYNGWIFPCYFCGANTSSISIINNYKGTVKTNVCKDCKKSKLQKYLDTKINYNYDYFNIYVGK